MANKHMKRCPKSYVIRETQLKQPLDTATHLTEWPKSGKLMTPNVDENVEQ